MQSIVEPAAQPVSDVLRTDPEENNEVLRYGGPQEAGSAAVERDLPFHHLPREGHQGSHGRAQEISFCVSSLSEKKKERKTEEFVCWKLERR